MTDEQVFELAERNSFQDDSGCWIFKDEGLLDFVFMVQKAERERVAKWMMEQGYATGHGDTIEELLKQLDWQARDYAHKIEREACAKVCEDINIEFAGEDVLATWCARAILERGEK